MSTLLLLLEKGVAVLGWTLLHSLWQGLLIGCLYALLRTLARHESECYALGVLMLGGMIVGAIGTSLHLWNAIPPAELLPFATATIATTSAEIVSTTSTNWLWLEALLPWLVALWISGVLVLSFNLARQYAHLGRLIREDVDELPEWQTTLTRLCKVFAITRPIRLLRSTQVNTPTLIGLLRPVILLPVGMIAGFTPYQIEMMLAHELGHIRRWDYLVNLGQIAIETILFYHPVVHWISRDVRNVREICCDELALSLTKSNPVDYAHVLEELEDLRGLKAPALAASGGVLLARIRRIITLTSSPGAVSYSTLGCFIVAFMLCMGVVAIWSLSTRQKSFPTVSSTADISISSIFPTKLSFGWTTAFSVTSQAIPPFIKSLEESNDFLNAHSANTTSKFSFPAKIDSKHAVSVSTPAPSRSRLQPASGVTRVKQPEAAAIPVSTLISNAMDSSVELKSSGAELQVAAEDKLIHEGDSPVKATSTSIQPSGETMLTQQDPLPQDLISKNAAKNQVVCEQRRRLGSNIKEKVCRETKSALTLSSHHMRGTGGSLVAGNSSSYSSALNGNYAATSTSALTKSGLDNIGTRVTSPYRDSDLTKLARPMNSCGRAGC